MLATFQFKEFFHLNNFPIQRYSQCNNWIRGCCITNSEKDEKSSQFMVTLESLIWKVGNDLDRPSTYWISSKCWKLYVIYKGIDWKSMSHQDIMCFDILFQMYWPCRYSTIQNIVGKCPHKPPILVINVIFVTYWCSFFTMPWCKSNKKLGFNMTLLGFFYI